MFDDAPQALAEVPERFFRRRLLVFCGSFALACLVSLIYVYARPAEYRSVALIQISPPGTVAESSDDKSPGLAGDPKAFLTEVQVLTSRPLLQQAARRLKALGKLPALGKDPVEAMQRMLQAEPVVGTQVAQLSATGTEPVFAADLVNMVSQLYRLQLNAGYKERAASLNADIGDEARRLHEQVVAKQREVDAFRERYDIVSLDRKENEVLGKIEGLNRSYADSNEQFAKAQGRLAGLRSALAAGKPIVRPQDAATLAAIETQLTELRTKKRALDRRYSAAYQVLDEETKTLPAQIAELEQDLKDRRTESAREAIEEAQGNLAGAQSAVARLRGDLGSNQTGAREFATRLSAFKVMQDDLDHLTAMERAVNDRAVKLKASVRERAPGIRLVEAAAPSLTPFRPNYTRDALIAVTGSFLFALLATWLAEFLRGPAPPRQIMVHHSVALPSLGRFAAPALRALERPLLGAFSRPSLPAPEPAQRELQNGEITALLVNASDELRLVALALLSGLDVEEIAALTWGQIDLAVPSLHVGGAYERTIPLESALASLLRQRQQAAGPVLCNDRGEALSAQDIDRLVVYGAYDAGLAKPQEIKAATLRQNYLGFLLRQGVRAADISRIAGHIPQDEMVAFMQRSSPRTRLPLEQVDRIHPVLRGLSAA